MAVAGAHGVATDAAGADPCSPAPAGGVIQADDDRLPGFDRCCHQLAGELPCEVAGSPADPVEDLVT